MKKLNLMLPILLSLIASVSAQTDEFGNCPIGGMMYGSYGLGIGIFSWAFGLLVVVALILLIIWLIKQIQKK